MDNPSPKSNDVSAVTTSKDGSKIKAISTALLFLIAWVIFIGSAYAYSVGVTPMELAREVFDNTKRLAGIEDKQVFRDDIQAYLVSDIVDENGESLFYAVRFYSREGEAISELVAVDTGSISVDDKGVMSVQIIDEPHTAAGAVYASVVINEETVNPNDIPSTTIEVGDPCIVSDELYVFACDYYVLELDISEYEQNIAEGSEEEVSLLSNVLATNKVKGVSVSAQAIELLYTETIEVTPTRVAVRWPWNWGKPPASKGNEPAKPNSTKKPSTKPDTIKPSTKPDTKKPSPNKKTSEPTKKPAAKPPAKKPSTPKKSAAQKRKEAARKKAADKKKAEVEKKKQQQKKLEEDEADPEENPEPGLPGGEPEGPDEGTSEGGPGEGGDGIPPGTPPGTLPKLPPKSPKIDPAVGSGPDGKLPPPPPPSTPPKNPPPPSTPPKNPPPKNPPKDPNGGYDWDKLNFAPGAGGRGGNPPPPPPSSEPDFGMDTGLPTPGGSTPPTGGTPPGGTPPTGGTPPGGYTVPPNGPKNLFPPGTNLPPLPEMTGGTTPGTGGTPPPPTTPPKNPPPSNPPPPPKNPPPTPPPKDRKLRNNYGVPRASPNYRKIVDTDENAPLPQ